MVQCLNGLGHNAVISCDHEDCHVGDLRTTGTHSGERLVTGGIDEGNRAVFTLNGGVDLVCTNVLGNAAGLTLNDVGVTDSVQQAGLTVVNVTHDGNDRGTSLQDILALSFCFGFEVDVEGLEQLALLILRGNDLDRVTQFGTQQLEGLLVQGLSLGSHLTQVEENRNQRCRVCANLLSEVHDGRATAQTNLGRAVAARNNHATGCRCVQLFLLVAASCLRLAALTLGAAATECALGVAAAAGAGTTRTAVEAAVTATCAAAVTATVVRAGCAATNVGYLRHHRGVRACTTGGTLCTGTCATGGTGATVTTGTCATCGTGTAVTTGTCATGGTGTAVTTGTCAARGTGATVTTGTTVTCRTGTA